MDAIEHLIRRETEHLYNAIADMKRGLEFVAKYNSLADHSSIINAAEAIIGYSAKLAELEIIKKEVNKDV